MELAANLSLKSLLFAFDALDWVLKNFDPEDSGDRLAEELLSGMTSENVELALEKSLIEALDAQEVGFEAYVVAHLATSNVDAAIKALPRLRNEKTRDKAIQQSAYRLGLYHQWNDAWEFGSGLTKSERTSFYDDVIERWLYTGSRGYLARIESLPSSELRSRAAMWTIEWGRAYKDLSWEEETELRKFLLEDDIEYGDNITLKIITAK